MSHIGFTVSIGQKPVMPYSNKSLWQAVKQEPADKFNRRDRDGYGFIFLSILGVKGHLVAVKGSDAAVGNCHPVGISGQILQDPFGLLNRFSDTDDPRMGIEFIFERLVSLAKTQFSATHGTGQMVNELAAKDQRERLLVEQVMVLTRDPSVFVL